MNSSSPTQRDRELAEQATLDIDAAPTDDSCGEISPLDPKIKSIQPGGGFCMQVELAWGKLRRAYLKTFRRGYIERMAKLRRGDHNACPHEVLDPRDTKFYRNQGGYHWQAEDDPFRWRDRIPFARAGLAELLMMGGTLAALTVGMLFLPFPYALLAAGPAVLFLLIVWFFRDPPRRTPTEAGLVIAPADGKVVLIEEIDYDDDIGGPAVLIGIFLSIFNVHINRAPVESRILQITYQPGKMLNALRPESARENERVSLCLQEVAAPHRKMVVRQITGAIARRIVCWVTPGEVLDRGEQFGMIKLGSRTELLLPREEGLRIDAALGDTIKAGATILARYESDSTD